MTRQQFEELLREYMLEHPTLRRGQAAYHMLELYYPQTMSYAISGSKIDPYYNDKNVEAVLAFFKIY